MTSQQENNGYKNKLSDPVAKYLAAEGYSTATGKPTEISTRYDFDPLFSVLKTRKGKPGLLDYDNGLPEIAMVSASKTGGIVYMEVGDEKDIPEVLRLAEEIERLHDLEVSLLLTGPEHKKT